MKNTSRKLVLYGICLFLLIGSILAQKPKAKVRKFMRLIINLTETKQLCM